MRWYRSDRTMKTLITIIRSVVALAGVAGRNFLSVQFMKTNLNLLTLGILLSLAGASFGQPVITTQPQSSTNAAGTTATFWVAGTGTPPLAYQWQKLNSTWLDLTGSTDTNLSLS